MKNCFLALCLMFTATSVHSQNIPKWKITDVEKYVAKTDGVVIINMWATFCKPCVAELPGFIKVVEQYKDQNVKLLLVSLDLPSMYPKKIAAFAKKHKFNTQNMVWLNETNADYFCHKIDPSWTGSIPATVFINSKTGYKRFVEEEMTAAEFERQVKAAIKG